MTLDTTRWTVLAPLLQAASAGHDLLTSTIRTLGADKVAKVITAETGHHDVKLDLHFDGTTTSHLNTNSDTTVELDLVDAVRSLYGTDNRHPSLNVRTGWADTAPGDHAAILENRRHIPVAVNGLLKALNPQHTDLNDLAVEFGSDKWGDMHWYTQHYQRHFAHLRTEPVKVLEIGIGGYTDPDAGGSSLKMWQRFFRRGLIHGMDIAPKNVTGPRIMTIQGDQSDPDFLDELGKSLGPFDVIIDDGSHLNEHVRISFHALFPHLRNGGIYVVEDVQTAYWPRFGGSPEAGEGTSIAMLKSFVDGLNHADVHEKPTYLERNISGITFHHNIAFIDKGRNDEEGGPQFLRG